MRLMIPFALVLSTSTFVWASDIKKEFYLIGGKEKTKVEAIRALLTDKSTRAYRCNEVELTDKLTIRKKK